MIRVLEADDSACRVARETDDLPLDVVVLHTSDTSTRQALKTAATYAKELSAHVHLVAPRVVPFALDLNAPQVPVSFTARQLREIAGEAGVDASIDIILCRDLVQTLASVLKPQSLIVLGERKSPWWRLRWMGRENRLAQQLRAQGHQVVPADLA
ncbi:MAG: hypothetical protein P4K98_14140 [Bryobacteraceae bacterium]|nr:hypothetical protein [Bryobacteraceae bacterium]